MGLKFKMEVATKRLDVSVFRYRLAMHSMFLVRHLSTKLHGSQSQRARWLFGTGIDLYFQQHRTACA